MNETTLYVSTGTALAVMIAVAALLIVLIIREERRQRRQLVERVNRLLTEGEATPAQLARAACMNEAKVRQYLLKEESLGHVTARWYTPTSTSEPRDRYYVLTGK